MPRIVMQGYFDGKIMVGIALVQWKMVKRDAKNLLSQNIDRACIYFYQTAKYQVFLCSFRISLYL